MNDEEKNGSPSELDEEKEEKEETPDLQPSLDDPIKKEVKKLEKKKFTKRERLNFEKGKIDQQLKELDKEEGVETLEDETPVTLGMLKKLDQDKSKKTALDLAEDIEDDDERELTKHYIKDRVTPSGDPKEDLRIARAIVNSLKNSQIAEEVDRKKNPKNKGTNPGSPGTHEKEFRPTEEERVFMNPPYNLTNEDIIKARKQKEANSSK